MNRPAFAAAALSLLIGSAAAAQDAAPAADPLTQLAQANLQAKSARPIAVTSPAFAAQGDIPFRNTQYRDNLFPGLGWSKGPAGTKSYAIIMQDPDSIYKGMPILHWTMLDIPAAMTSLPPEMKDPPAGSQYGPNGHGHSQPWRGPHTPPGPKHHYHIQVFALDTVIPNNPDIEYDALLAAMKGHVLAKGELIGLSYADPEAPPPKPPTS